MKPGVKSGKSKQDQQTTADAAIRESVRVADENEAVRKADAALERSLNARAAARIEPELTWWQKVKHAIGWE